MDEKFLSWMGLEVSRRTCVTKPNCTPLSQNERCGKAFIFNRVSYLGTQLASSQVGSGSADPLSLSTRLPCNDCRKELAWIPVSQALGVCCCIENLSKVQASLA